MVDAVNALIRSPPLVLLAGVFAVAVGLGVVVGHNVWSGGALPVVVTLVGWAALIKGFALLALPPGQMAKLYEVLRYERFYIVGVTLALGLYLTIAAFTAWNWDGAACSMSASLIGHFGSSASDYPPLQC